MKYQPQVLEIPLGQIIPDPNQPRKDFSDVKRLARSMKSHGQLQPILVTKYKEGKFMIVEGDSRYKAAKSLQWETIRCIVIEVEDDKRRDFQFAANLMRSNLNPFELADEYHRIMSQDGFSQAQLAEEVDDKTPTVSATLKLRNLPAEIKTRLAPISKRTGLEALVLVARSNTLEAMEKLVALIESGAKVSELRKTYKVLKKTTGKEKTEPLIEEKKSLAGQEPALASSDANEPDEINTIDQHPTLSSEETFDEKIISAWFDSFSVHAIRVSDLLAILPDSLELNSTSMIKWLHEHLGLVIMGYRVFSISIAPSKVVHQLIPENLDRPDYVSESNERLAEHREKANKKT